MATSYDIPGDAARSIQSEADEATQVACKMLETGLRGRQPRFEMIKKNEDQYFGKNPPALKGHSNIPFDTVIMRGFLDTLLANSSEPVKIQFHREREQDKMRADKLTAVWERESAPSRGAWDYKFDDTKLLAAMSGRGFNKLFVGSTPKFETDLEVCDHYDMVTEPQGGAYLDKHLFKFQMNIFRTKDQLLDPASFYDKTQVRKIILKSLDPAVQKGNTDFFKNKNNRFASFGLDLETEAYVGQPLYRLVEGVINFKGKWCYIVFAYESKTWVRFQPLEEVFEHAKEYPGRGAWTSWATHRHPFIFWNLGPADDVRPIAYTMKKIVNYTVDNLEKRNWDMKAYDPKIFTDPTQLLYRQDGIVRATLKPGQSIAQGIYPFNTPDTVGVTINLASWLDSFLAKKTGITDELQGDSGESRVGITYANIQNSSKRLMLTNKQFSQSVVDLGVMFDYGCYEHLREPYAVKMIGLKGVKWEEVVTHRDLDCDFSISVRSGDEEEKKSASAVQKKEAMFQRLEANPNLLSKLNDTWYLREVLSDGGIPLDQIKIALDKNSEGDDDLMAEAAQSIDDIINGKKPAINYAATTGFVRKILNFARDNEPDPSQKEYPGQSVTHMVYMTLLAYADAHIKIALENMTKDAMSVLANGGAIGPGAPAPLTPPGTAPAAPGGTPPIAAITPPGTGVTAAPRVPTVA